jgi:hypothetical protein
LLNHHRSEPVDIERASMCEMFEPSLDLLRALDVDAANIHLTR